MKLGAAGLGLRRLERLAQRGDVLGVSDVLDVPAVGGVARGDVLAEGHVGVALDRDVVVVIEHDEVAELLVAGEAAGLRRDALLHVAVGDEHQMVWSKTLSPGLASGSYRPRSRRAAMAMPTAVAMPWPSGPVVVSTPSGVAVLRVTRGQAAPLPVELEVVEGQAVAGQVELDVEGQAGVPARKHEAVPADPVRVGRVVPEELLEEQVGGGRQAHRGSGVAVAGRLHGVHGQGSDQVDGVAVEVRGPAAVCALGG